MQRVIDVLSLAWGALVLVVGIVMLVGIALVGVLSLLPFLAFVMALL